MEDLDLELDDVLLFELPSHDDVVSFCERFRSRWDGWSDIDGQVWLFTVELKQCGDLPLILREAQQLLAELRLESIRYCLDGRVYLLEAAQPSAEESIAGRTTT